MFACELNSVKIKLKMLIFQSFFWMIIVIHFFCNFFLKRNSSSSYGFLLMYCTELKKFFDSKELSNLLSSWIRYFKLLLQEQFFKIKNDVAVKFEFEVKEFFLIFLFAFLRFFFLFLLVSCGKDFVLNKILRFLKGL